MVVVVMLVLVNDGSGSDAGGSDVGDSDASGSE